MIEASFYSGAPTQHWITRRYAQQRFDTEMKAATGDPAAAVPESLNYLSAELEATKPKADQKQDEQLTKITKLLRQVRVAAGRAHITEGDKEAAYASYYSRV